MPNINAKPQMILKWGQIRCQMFQAHIQIAMICARWALNITAIRGCLQRTPNIGVMQKLCKLMLRCCTNNRMIKTLFARPVIVTDHTVPRIAHDGKDEIIPHRRCIDDPINIPKGAVFPQSTHRRKVRQTFAPPLGLGRVPDNDIIRLGPRLKRERHGCAACFWRMNKNIAPPV